MTYSNSQLTCVANFAETAILPIVLILVLKVEKDGN